MKNQKISRVLGVRLTDKIRIWENLNPYLRNSSKGLTDREEQHNRIREEIMQDLKHRSDRRPIISLPGIPE